MVLMIIVWRGWGILALLIWIACLGVSQLLTDEILGKGFYTAHMWPKILASAIPVPFIWLKGRALNGAPSSEERQLFGPRHTFFWIAMEYWGIILFIFGIVAAIVFEFKKA